MLEVIKPYIQCYISEETMETWTALGNNGADLNKETIITEENSDMGKIKIKNGKFVPITEENSNMGLN